MGNQVRLESDFGTIRNTQQNPPPIAKIMNNIFMSHNKEIFELTPGSHSPATFIKIYHIPSTLTLFWEKFSPMPTHFICQKFLISSNIRYLKSTLLYQIYFYNRFKNQLNSISEDYGLSIGGPEPTHSPHLSHY